MNALHAIVLGIVQGLTEFLPVSSSAHLRIVPAFLGWKDPGAAFTAVVQLGTIAAVLVFFREDLLRLARTWLRGLRDPAVRRDDHDYRLAWLIIWGTAPVAIFGLIFNNAIEKDARGLGLIASALIVFSFVLLAAERAGSHKREIASIEPRDGITIGLAQALALIPGVSRSGATISAGLFLGLERAAAARYSFLLSVPAIVLSGLFELRKVGESGGAGAVPTVIATLLAFVVGYASIAFLLRYLVAHTIGVFAGYRIALGVLILALLAAGLL